MTAPAQPRPARPRKSKLPRLIAQYYADLKDLAHQHVMYEMGTRPAFHALLASAGKEHGWTLIAEHEKKINGKLIRPDGTFKDSMNLVRGYWEAKDTADDLDAEIEKKRKSGYPLTNIIFEDTATAILYQHGQRILSADMKDPAKLADLITEFFRYIEPEIQEFEQAVDEFKVRVPDLAEGLKTKIDQAHKSNPAFKKAFADFFELCRTSLNPNLSQSAVDEMLIQHILTERLIREVFDNPEFVRRNVIAAEVEKVMLAMTSQSFDRNTYLKDLDRFYIAIERAARTMTDWADKQHFLNTVYERFFQGYSVKLADTMGIVYTPQEIVNFMCASVAEVLEKEFGKHLWSDDVFIIDPCTGTGNFIVNLIRRIPKAKLEAVYKHRLFANEIMLLPYYIAALNIEHAYYEQTGGYEPFEGLCFVDTLDLAHHAQAQLGFMTPRNSERVDRQRKSPITVVIGNPPYNTQQENENDRNKNRLYPEIDERIKQTYVRSSNATLRSKLYDPYLRFFRWASDRLGREGVIAFVSNNYFLDGLAFDGVRKELAKDFQHIYVFDLKGNVRKDSMRGGIPIGEEHTVFGLGAMVGVAVSIFVKKPYTGASQIHYAEVDFRATRVQKFAALARAGTMYNSDLRTITPGERANWLTSPSDIQFGTFLSIGSRQAKLATGKTETIFKTYSHGISTNRDTVVYDFSREVLAKRIDSFADNYNAEVDRYHRKGEPKDLDEFLDFSRIKWSRNLKSELKRLTYLKCSASSVREALYRPFTRKLVYFADVAIDERGRFPLFFPTIEADAENRVIAVSDIGYRADTYNVMIANTPADLHLAASLDGHQCFPFYTYDEDGSNRRENITDWALEQFRSHYHDSSIDKWAIFHYVYALLHHPAYRAKFADNLKRELPRIPFAPPLSPSPGTPSPDNPRPGTPGRGQGEGSPGPSPSSPLAAVASSLSSGFHAFSRAGQQLAALHLDYEKLEPYPLEFIETAGVPLSYRVDDKMRLSKDKTALTVNKSLKLVGIPPETFTYRLGNRSALEWVIDQYQLCTNPRSGIASDPNRDDDPQYIVRLVGQVIRVSLETMNIVNALPAEFSDSSPGADINT